VHPRLFLVALLLVALLLAFVVACVPASGPTPSPEEPTPGSIAGPTESLATSEPSPSVGPLPTPTPTLDPSVEPTLPTPSESAGSRPAAACSGNDQNREFFEAAAAALQWTVYCAVLPTGWFVVSGEYRQAGGGRLEIAYRGPGGARFELREGGFCADADGCVPSGTEIGDAAFDGQTGTLIATDDGGWAIVVDRGEAISWHAIGTGVEEDAFRAIAAALAAVND
jgi:hypothetical protein